MLKNIEIEINNDSNIEKDKILNVFDSYFDDEFSFDFNDNQIEIQLGSLDYNSFQRSVNKVVGNGLLNGDSKEIVIKILDSITNIKSYGLKSGKRVYVDYNKERKVQNRKEKESKRQQFYYTKGNNFSTTNIEIPAEYENKIICGDSKSVLSDLPNNCIDLVITSPPYDDLRNYKGYSFDFESIAVELFRVMKEGGIVVWVVGDKIKNGDRTLTSFKQCLYFQDVGFNVHDVMIYQKKNTPFMRSNAYTNCFEFMFVFSKNKVAKFNPIKTKTARYGIEKLVSNKKADGINNKVVAELKEEKTLTNIWSYAVGLGGSTKDKIAFQHPAIFPEKLAQDHILSWTNEGDLVLDPMCGSGTTCKMAKLNKRNYLGIEISADYAKLAKKRLDLLDEQLL